MTDKKPITRRQFFKSCAQVSLGLALVGLVGYSVKKSTTGHWLWQIDPFKCTACGRCATHCVQSQSAVRCVHAYALCGYCDLCSGYLKINHVARNSGAENQLCPTAAIERKFIEEPYYEYTINEKLCIACGKCVKGCSDFGNGSLQLQIRHNHCLNCNQCAIADACPSHAIKRVFVNTPYIIKGDFEPE